MELIASHGWLFIILAVAFGFFMTWGIGANDVANAMGTSVGSGAINIKQAIIIAAIFEFAGAFIAGANVTDTIRKGIVEPSAFSGQPELLIFGMLAALLASATWLVIASSQGWPVSTTHTIVGSIIGFAIVSLGIDSVDWNSVGAIVASWVVSPLLGAIISFLLMLSIHKFILSSSDPFVRAKLLAPIYVFLVGFMITLVTLFKGLSNFPSIRTLSTGASIMVAFIVGFLVATIGMKMIRRIHRVYRLHDVTEPLSSSVNVERVFTPLVIFTACAMAFAHGSNDVANGIGPLVAVISIVNLGGAEVAAKAAVPLWILLLGGCGIVIGLATYGRRVMQTIGSKITKLTPTSAYCATLAAAATVVLASKLKLPVSTTHIAVGAVIGVGLIRGSGGVDVKVLRQIVLSWLITLPAGGTLAAGLYYLLKVSFS